jgi:hypothetical protein
MYELFFEKPPFTSAHTGFGSMWSLGIDIATNGLRPLIPEDTDDYQEDELQYLEIMKQCWSDKPEDRPSSDELARLIVGLKNAEQTPLYQLKESNPFL